MLETPNDRFDLSGRVALVTGSSRGIGKAIARGLAGAGAEVLIHGQTLDAAGDAATALTTEGATAQALAQDLSLPGAGKALLAQCAAMGKCPDILVINASAQINAELADLTHDDLTLQLNVNLRATVEMLQAALPAMAARGWGRVVSIGSINQFGPKPVVTAYAATKAAQHNLIQSQARDFARSGVVLNTLAPGLVDTDRNAQRKKSDPEGWARYVTDVNWMGRAASADEMVGAALFLASDACSFVTGELVTVSGGY